MYHPVITRLCIVTTECCQNLVLMDYVEGQDFIYCVHDGLLVFSTSILFLSYQIVLLRVGHGVVS